MARRILLGLLGAIHVAVIVAVGLGVQYADPSRPEVFVLALGICSAEASLAAFWLALGPFRWLTRAAIAGLAMALAAIPFLGQALSEGDLTLVVVFDGVQL